MLLTAVLLPTGRLIFVLFFPFCLCVLYISRYLFLCFSTAQNENVRLFLAIVLLSVPPDRMSIRDEFGIDRASVVGPYSEGDMVTLKCEVFGGELQQFPCLTSFPNGNPTYAQNPKHTQTQARLNDKQYIHITQNKLLMQTKAVYLRNKS